MKIINIAKTTLGESDSFKNSVESYFIDCLKEKSYYNDKRDYLTDTEIQLKQKFLKCLVDKKYITQKKYKEIWNDLFKEKSVFIQIREEKEEEVIINDSYDIHEEEYVSDYENVHIDGLEYYCHKIRNTIVDNNDYAEVGIWDRSSQKIKFHSDEFLERHTRRMVPQI